MKLGSCDYHINYEVVISRNIDFETLAQDLAGLKSELKVIECRRRMYYNLSF